MTDQTRQKIQELTKLLTTDFQSGDPAIKAEWDKMRKNVSAGLAALETQLTTAETGLHAAEKGVIVGGGNSCDSCYVWSWRSTSSWSCSWNGVLELLDLQVNSLDT